MSTFTKSPIVFAAVFLICGCGAPNGPATAPAQLQVAGGSAAPEANWGTDKPSQADNPSNQSGSTTAGSAKIEARTGPRFQRGALLAKQNNANSAPTVNPLVAQYGQPRLERAAVIRNWAHVSVAPVGIDAFIKTAWTGGFLQVRLALLGPKDNLEQFAREQNNLKLTFQDRAGNPLYQFIIPIDQIKEAPPGVNGGTPTFAVEGSMEIPLELYEDFYQWMFEWD